MHLSKSEKLETLLISARSHRLDQRKQQSTTLKTKVRQLNMKGILQWKDSQSWFSNLPHCRIFLPKKRDPTFVEKESSCLWKLAAIRKPKIHSVLFDPEYKRTSMKEGKRTKQPNLEIYLFITLYDMIHIIPCKPFFILLSIDSKVWICASLIHGKSHNHSHSINKSKDKIWFDQSVY